MTHEPECDTSAGCYGVVCMCDVVRAAYRRGVADVRAAVAAAFTDNHKDDWGVQCLYKSDALAAIDALAGDADA